ncbi:hypothetical protein K525DRAFT_254721 [Schizophyllum commune Loenen D]|nr:hypothetical protein K525DRAFT_254721 [Schizophyllum commune Loenen D]
MNTPSVNTTTSRRLQKPRRHASTSTRNGAPPMSSRTGSASKSTRYPPSNRHSRSFRPSDFQRRSFFGLSEILGVVANPAETLRSLAESRKLLSDAKQELAETRERQQLRPKHTFSPLAGFFPRKKELRAIERTLGGEPAFTVLFGSSSVGKTALLRQVLTEEKFNVLHFDLRIAGFADLSSLYISLSEQMEQYFLNISTEMEGYEEFEKESWAFKHDRADVQKRINDAPNELSVHQIRTSDIARLMELFQSSLLKYWQFEPEKHKKEKRDKGKGKAREEPDPPQSSASSTRWGLRRRRASEDLVEERRLQEEQHRASSETDRRNADDTNRTLSGSEGNKSEAPRKRMPVVFFDEAHRLPDLLSNPASIGTASAMQCLLDAMLVLTKQDRLCHVVFATSDAFFHTWLRRYNVLQHAKLLTIGDCTKAETRAFFNDRLLPRVPQRLQGSYGMQFERLYAAFGGHLTHWADYVTDYVNAGGVLDIKQSSHFLQAHALLNLLVIHTAQRDGKLGDAEGSDGEVTPNQSVATLLPNGGRAPPPSVAPQARAHTPSTMRTLAPVQPDNDEDSAHPFTALQLLRVMSRLRQEHALPYFSLCREYGVSAVDGMVRARVLDIRWTDPVADEAAPERTGVTEEWLRRQMGRSSDTAVAPDGSVHVQDGVPMSGVGMGPEDEDDELQPLNELEAELAPVVGPKCVPMTPIMRYAMAEVVAEYEDTQSVSDYVSLSDVDEY